LKKLKINGKLVMGRFYSHYFFIGDDQMNELLTYNMMINELDSIKKTLSLLEIEEHELFLMLDDLYDERRELQIVHNALVKKIKAMKVSGEFDES
jgi:hypothetical protein